MSQPLRLAVFQLAHELRQPIDVIEQMSEEEFWEWVAYFRWLHSRNQHDDA